MSSIFDVCLRTYTLSDTEIEENINKSKSMENCFNRKEASVLSTVLKKVGSISNL